MTLYIFPITREEHEKGLGGWDLIKKNPDRVIPFNFPNDYSTIITLYDSFIVYEGKVYEAFKKYVDIAGDKLIYMIFEVQTKCDTGKQNRYVEEIFRDGEEDENGGESV